MAKNILKLELKLKDSGLWNSGALVRSYYTCIAVLNYCLKSRPQTNLFVSGSDLRCKHGLLTHFG